MTTKTQTRGNCQCCGRDQAVTRGRISKHGYTVENGWFQGVCNGHHYAHMQQDRTVTDKLVVDIRTKAAILAKQAEYLNSGKIRPDTVRMGHNRNAEQVPYDAAPAWAQKEAVRRAIIEAGNRAAAGEAIALQLEALAAQAHGRPLREVLVDAEKPAPILPGEKRTLSSGAVA